MNKSQRIYFGDKTDKYIKIKLEQDVDSLEFLSMDISAKDVYQDFNSDYGVLVGRVVANGGIGIPNAKISIFIPLTNEDAKNGEIYGIYPYKTPRDKNNDGKRYNLLPRVSVINPETGVSEPKQPFGSFPIKEEIVTNQPFLDVYKKYYKYTALTNDSGDYMIFGVPIGTQTVHLSVDITDIGEYSMNPAAMVTNLGYSPNFFIDNNTKIKPSNDLGDLPHIETQEITVDIVPFWGDVENFEIGITRQDFRIRSVLKNTFVMFGSVFTDGDKSLWGDDFHGNGKYIDETFRAIDDANNTVGILSKRIGKVTEKIYYYPPEISDEKIDNGYVADDGSDMILLDPSNYSIYKRDGDFAFIINCNRNRIITDNEGNPIPVDSNSPNGVFTEFRGFVTLEITPDEIPMNFSSAFGSDSEIKPFRYILKFPQHSNRDESFERPAPSNDIENNDTIKWRKQNYTFTGGKLYSFAKFHGTTFNNHGGTAGDDNDQFPLINGFFEKDTINDANKDPFWNVGIILNGDYDDYDNSQYQFPSNNSNNRFGSNWMNLSIYLPQLGYVSKEYSEIKYVRSADHFTKYREDNNGFNIYYMFDNQQSIAAGYLNTKWMARSDLNWTDIIEVPKTDVIKMNNVIPKGFTTNTLVGLTGTTYRYGDYTPIGWSAPCPINGGKENGTGNPSDTNDTNKYFYKGFDTADCIKYIISLGLV